MNLQVATSFLDGRLHVDHFKLQILGKLVQPFFPGPGQYNNMYSILTGENAGFQGSFTARGLPNCTAVIAKEAATSSVRPE